MVNFAIIAIVFFILIFIIAIFVAQQFYAAQQIRAKSPKTLIEKLSSKGLGALDTDKFKEIVLSGGSEEPASIPALSSMAGSEGLLTGTEKTGEQIEEKLFRDYLDSVGHQVNIENKDLQSIYSEYLSAKNLNPFDVEPDFKLGVAYLRFAQFDKAQKQFQKVIDSKPNFSGIYYYMGEAYRCNGQFYEAMNAYKKSWETDRVTSRQPEEQRR
ncbi:MAG TPA: hypothetical protein VM123_20445 [archaeon]|nr:hypothetical protein [archaeon]